MTAPFEAYAALICDLDGVVYRGQAAVPHAVEALSTQRRPVLYATNNAARTPDVVAAHLRELGLAVEASDVVNSSQAAAWLLARHQPPGAAVLAVGGPGVGVALREAGFQVVERIGTERVDAVVQGYGPTVTASDLAEAAYGVQGGALWVATNLDSTLPTDRGVAPGGLCGCGCQRRGAATRPGGGEARDADLRIVRGPARAATPTGAGHR